MSLVIDIAAATKDLVSVDEAKEELGIASSDSSHDARLAKLITRVSEMIEKYTGIVWHEETVTETRQGSGTSYQTVKRRFITELLEFKYIGVVQTLTEFVIENGETGYLYHKAGFRRVERAGRYHSIPIDGTGDRDWEMQYKAGFEFIPEYVKAGCLEVLKAVFFTGGPHALNPALKSGDLADASFEMRDTGVASAGTTTIIKAIISEHFEMEVA